MNFKVGTLAVIFFIIGVLLFLAIPVVVNWVTQVRFSRRFEQLVRDGQVIPVFEIDEKVQERLSRRRVTLRSLLDVFVTYQSSSNDQSTWKPIAAAFVEQQDSPLKEAILTTRDQRKEAKRSLKTVRARALHGHQDVERFSADVSGKVRSCALILMPVSTRRHYREGGENGEKRVRRFTTVSGLPSSEVPYFLGEEQEAVQSPSDATVPTTMQPFELGMIEQNLEQASEIPALINEEESIVSLEDDAADEPLRPTAYTVIYAGGRPYIVPARRIGTNPLLPGRIRVY